ncbi:hypothetical protein Q1695_009918 [Nippostrongylus brasiliensis]|nr:hypothetical protein Q1695_009918 [Nippostrongylus brasiliensis]
MLLLYVILTAVTAQHPDYAMSQVYPFTFPSKIKTEDVMWATEGFLRRYPTHAVLYDPPVGESVIYLFPTYHCEGVWLCFIDGLDRTKGVENAYEQFDFENACRDSLRFQTLEQVVYVYKNGQYKVYPYLSNKVTLTSEMDNTTTVFKFTASHDTFISTIFAYSEVTDKDVDQLHALEKDQSSQTEFRVKIRQKVLLLTSSSYCHARIMQPFQGVVSSEGIDYWHNVLGVMHTGSTPASPNSTYILSGTASGSYIRAAVPFVSTAFDSPRTRARLQKTEYDCCPFSWEHEQFLDDEEWGRSAYTTYFRYSFMLKDTSRCEPTGKAGKNYPYMSFLVERGKRCEWIRLCFDRKAKDPKQQKFCSNEIHSIAFLFGHGVYIGTDTDEARQFGLEPDDLDTIRINFLRGVRGIEIGYAFADPATAGIRELMQLEIYNGADPTNLVVSVTRAPQCYARLLNDLAFANLRREGRSQCLMLESCTCLSPQRRRG